MEQMQYPGWKFLFSDNFKMVTATKGKIQAIIRVATQLADNTIANILNGISIKGNTLKM